MAIDQIEYCGGCMHYATCSKNACVWNAGDSSKPENRVKSNHEDAVQFGAAPADVVQTSYIGGCQHGY